MSDLFTHLSSRRIAALIRAAEKRVCYVAPGIQSAPAQAIAGLMDRLLIEELTVSLDFDERTLRMGYGSLEAVETLRDVGIEPIQSPGFRSGVLIVDGRGWIFTPIALYLEQEPQSDETPNAVELSSSQVSALMLRLSPQVHKEAVENAATPEECQELATIQLELGVTPISVAYFENVKTAIQIAPPVKFDLVRQVRVFEPFLQYVELALSGAAVQRQRVRIPKSLQNLGASKDLEGRLQTTFDLIEKGGALSSKPLDDELTEIRKNFTPSLGKDHGRLVLKSAKPYLLKRLEQLEIKLASHQLKLEGELQAKLDESKQQVIDYYFPLAKENPPDVLLGSLLIIDDVAIKTWIEHELNVVFPKATDLIQTMTLEVRYKDVTFETLNQPDFLGSVKKAFPRVNWEKAYAEFKAAGERFTAET